MPYVWAALGIIVCLALYVSYHPTAAAHNYYPAEYTFGDCEDARTTGCGFGA
jgi:hypothetical protein